MLDSNKNRERISKCVTSHISLRGNVFRPPISWAVRPGWGIRMPVFIRTVAANKLQLTAALVQEFYSRKYKVLLDPGALGSWVELFLLKKKKKK